MFSGSAQHVTINQSNVFSLELGSEDQSRTRAISIRTGGNRFYNTYDYSRHDSSNNHYGDSYNITNNGYAPRSQCIPARGISTHIPSTGLGTSQGHEPIRPLVEDRHPAFRNQPTRENQALSTIVNIDTVNQTIYVPCGPSIGSWGQPAPAYVPALSHREKFNPARRRPTSPNGQSSRAAIRDEVVAWGLDNNCDEDQKRIMWITGPARSGKTRLAGEIAEECQANRALAARHSIMISSASSSSKVVPSIARQLLKHREIKAMEGAFLDTVGDKPEILMWVPEEQLEAMILGPLRKTRWRPGRPWPTVILIDSSGDGASESNSPLLIPSALLRGVEDPFFPFRFIFLSRPDPLIREFFSTTAPDLVQELHLDYEYHRGAISILDIITTYAVASAIHNSPERLAKRKIQTQAIQATTDDIHAWITGQGDENDASKILWLTGRAGTGKTSVAEIIATKCDASGLLAASFFFSVTTSENDARPIQSLIATIVYQLLHHDNLIGFKEEMLGDDSISPEIFELSFSAQVDALILRPFKKLRDVHRSDAPKWPITIIIDGFDECGGGPQSGSGFEVQEDILSAFIKAAADPSFPFRIVVVSRPEPTIRGLFSSAAPGLVRELFLDEEYDPDGDIALFLYAKFAELRRRFGLPQSWPGEPVVTKLVHGSSGQFVFAATVLRFIESGTATPSALLDLVLALDTRPLGEHPSSQLDVLYTQIIRTSPEPILAVTWLHASLELYSEDSNNFAMMRAFLESVPGETEYLLGNLSALVDIKPNGTGFRFFHKSLSEFLTSPQRCGDLYVASQAVNVFLQDRWYTLLKNRGPQITIEASQQVLFFKYYAKTLTTRFFYTPGESPNYTQSDVRWWACMCGDLLSAIEYSQVLERVNEIVHVSCSRFRMWPCKQDCKIWRSTLKGRKH